MLLDWIASVKVSNIDFGSDISSKDFVEIESSRSLFHWDQLALSNIQVGGLDDRWMGSALRVVMTGRWSPKQ